jgi:hypothetical protein
MMAHSRNMITSEDKKERPISQLELTIFQFLSVERTSTEKWLGDSKDMVRKKSLQSSLIDQR